MRTRLLMPILPALLVLAAAGNAFSQAPDPALSYHIIAKSSGKCLDVAGAAVGNGGRVIQFDCTQGQNQQWKFTSLSSDPGYYKIEVVHSGRALDVFGGIYSLGDGVIVEQFGYNGGDNQKWKLCPAGPGYVRLVPKHSERVGKTLDIDPTGNAQQWAVSGDSGGDNQKFRLVALSRRRDCAGDQIGSHLIGTAQAASLVSIPPVPIDLMIDFTQCRSNFRITNRPTFTFAFSITPDPPNTTTVTLTAAGSGSVTDGNMSVPVTLHFVHSLHMNPQLAAGYQPLDLTLTLTGHVMPNGRVTLTGSATLGHGRLGSIQLDGRLVSLTVRGQITPTP